MKKKSFAGILLILSVVLVLSLTACSGLFGNSDPSRYYIDIGQVEDASVASIVANNSIASCVRVIADFSGGSSLAGSGFVITEDGYVLTNRHCVIRYDTTDSDTPKFNSDTPMSADYYVVFADNKKYASTLVSWCTAADIAVLKINTVKSSLPFAKELTFQPMVFETKQDLYYGQRAYTIGNPEDIGLMFSELTIACPSIRFSRKSEDGKTIIQDSFTSAVLDGNINHGNSGGPLINVNSRVSGIIYARIDGNKKDAYGIGCAIPTSEIISYINSIKGLTINYKSTPATAVSSGNNK